MLDRRVGTSGLDQPRTFLSRQTLETSQRRLAKVNKLTMTCAAARRGRARSGSAGAVYAFAVVLAVLCHIRGRLVESPTVADSAGFSPPGLTLRSPSLPDTRLRRVAFGMFTDPHHLHAPTPRSESDAKLLESLTPQQVRRYFPPPAAARRTREMPRDDDLRRRAFNFLTGTVSANKRGSADSGSGQLSPGVPLYQNVDSGVYDVAKRAAAAVQSLIDGRVDHEAGAGANAIDEAPQTHQVHEQYAGSRLRQDEAGEVVGGRGGGMPRDQRLRAFAFDVFTHRNATSTRTALRGRHPWTQTVAAGAAAPERGHGPGEKAGSSSAPAPSDLLPASLGSPGKSSVRAVERGGAVAPSVPEYRGLPPDKRLRRLAHSFMDGEGEGGGSSGNADARMKRATNALWVARARQHFMDGEGEGGGVNGYAKSIQKATKALRAVRARQHAALTRLQNDKRQLRLTARFVARQVTPSYLAYRGPRSCPQTISRCAHTSSCRPSTHAHFCTRLHVALRH